MSRRYLNNEGRLSLGECDYGFDPESNQWYVRPPGAHMGSIPEHNVEEHADGAITVTPSILQQEPTGESDANGQPILREVWHGHLTKGIFKSC